jgi:hypothetical protein
MKNLPSTIFKNDPAGDDTSRAHWTQRFQEEGRDPKRWLAYARGLKRAANAVLEQIKDECDWREDIISEDIYEIPEPERSRVIAEREEKLMAERDISLVELVLSSTRSYAYLMGAAIEDLIKAIYVVKKPEVIDTQHPKKMQEKLITHDLIRLVDALDIKLTYQADRDFLMTLTTCIKWSSKYPLPLNHDIYLEYFKDESGVIGPVGWRLGMKYESTRDAIENAQRAEERDLSGYTKGDYPGVVYMSNRMYNWFHNCLMREIQAN